MKYGVSPAEEDFKRCATIALVLIFIISVVHSGLKFLRNKHCEWKPDVHTKSLADGIRIPLNMIEKELAPSLIVITFCISVGCFYYFQLLLMISMIAISAFLFLNYRKVNQKFI